MPRRKPAIVPPAPRMTLSQWIEHDDGNASRLARPACNEQAEALHAQIACVPRDSGNGAADALPPPPGIGLAPLG